MKQLWTIVMCSVIFGKFSEGTVVNLTFPENFIFGAASAAYQVEGAWNVSDKGESIWDRFVHTYPERIANESNGDIACDSYYKYKEDVQLIKSIGLDFYRFSISWPRLLPTGFTNVISKDGLQYYKNLTAELVANNITPVVTIYHWDHPQILEEMGGWTNDLMVDWFVDYARVVFNALGDEVKIWVTVNEPNMLCEYGYNSTELAPGKSLNDIGLYLCMHNILKAHAKTYQMYNEEFRDTQKGEIGILPHCIEYIPANDSDTVSAETAFEFSCGWVAHPIFVGDYPEIMKTRIAMISEAQGYNESRLPEFSDEWIALINGSADYFGVNHYRSLLVSPDPAEEMGTYSNDIGVITSVNDSWPTTITPGWSVYPPGFRDLLRTIKDKYANPPVRVMENGYSDSGILDDHGRIGYHHDYLEEMLKAVNEDGCNVKSYSAWSLLDDFEWTSGYSVTFGMFYVDYNDTERPRTAKQSASWWSSVLETRELQPVPTNVSES